MQRDGTHIHIRVAQVVRKAVNLPAVDLDKLRCGNASLGGLAAAPGGQVLSHGALEEAVLGRLVGKGEGQRPGQGLGADGGAFVTGGHCCGGGGEDVVEGGYVGGREEMNKGDQDVVDAMMMVLLVVKASRKLTLIVLFPCSTDEGEDCDKSVCRCRGRGLLWLQSPWW